MKKIILNLFLLLAGTAAQAQLLGQKQIMIFAKQSDMASYTQQQNGQFGWANDVKSSFAYDSIGVAWMPLARVQLKKSTVVVNGKTTGNTLVYTTEASNLKFYPTQVIIRVSNISGVTTPPTISVGTNASNYDNIVTSSLLNTLLNTLGVGSGAPQNATYSIPINGSVPIYVKIGIGAIATNYSFTVELIGFYDIN